MLDIELYKRRGDFELDLKIEAQAARVIALFGTSGCGKTTAINLIAGLLKPDRGRLALNGRTVFDAARHIDIPAERRRIGYVFQDARLFPHKNVLGNLRYGLTRAPRTAKHFELDAVVELLGLQELLQRRPQQLSGGEKQRVAIGRALLSQPELLLLDEPLASLDQARREEVLPYLEKLRDLAAVPMVYVSHQFEEVLRLATHVVLLRDGKCVTQGTPSAISLHAELRRIVGNEAIGSVVEGVVTAVDGQAGLARIGFGGGEMHVESRGLAIGQSVRVQLLARDLILATEPPHHLSVRNALQATITRLLPDDPHAVLVEMDAGGVAIVARVTTAAAEQLQFRPGLVLWVLVKAMTLRGHVFISN